MAEDEGEEIWEEEEEVWAGWTSPIRLSRVDLLLVPSNSFGISSGYPFRLMYSRGDKGRLNASNLFEESNTSTISSEFSFSSSSSSRMSWDKDAPIEGVATKSG